MKGSVSQWITFTPSNLQTLLKRCPSFSTSLVLSFAFSLFPCCHSSSVVSHYFGRHKFPSSFFRQCSYVSFLVLWQQLTGLWAGMEGKWDVCGLSNRHWAESLNLPRISLKASEKLAYVDVCWFASSSQSEPSILGKKRTAKFLFSCVSLIIVSTNRRPGDLKVLQTDQNHWARQSILLFSRVPPPTDTQQLSICISSSLRCSFLAGRPARGKWKQTGV